MVAPVLAAVTIGARKSGSRVVPGGMVCLGAPAGSTIRRVSPSSNPSAAPRAPSIAGRPVTRVWATSEAVSADDSSIVNCWTVSVWKRASSAVRAFSEARVPARLRAQLTQRTTNDTTSGASQRNSSERSGASHDHWGSTSANHAATQPRTIARSPGLKPLYQHAIATAPTIGANVSVPERWSA